MIQRYNKKSTIANKLTTFETAELNERKKIRELAGQRDDIRIHMTTAIDSKKYYDFVALSSTTTDDICLIGEVKVRTILPLTYPTTIIEEIKFQGILEKVRISKEKHPDKDIRGYLVVFFSDNSVYGWEITGNEVKSQIRAKKTSVQYGDGDIIMKDVRNFKIWQGKKLR